MATSSYYLPAQAPYVSAAQNDSLVSGSSYSPTTAHPQSSPSHESRRSTSSAQSSSACAASASGLRSGPVRGKTCLGKSSGCGVLGHVGERGSAEKMARRLTHVERPLRA